MPLVYVYQCSMLCCIPLRAPHSLLQKGVLLDNHHVSQPVYPETMIIGKGFRLCAEVVGCAYLAYRPVSTSTSHINHNITSNSTTHCLVSKRRPFTLSSSTLCLIRSKASTPHTSGVRARSCGTREVHRNDRAGWRRLAWRSDARPTRTCRINGGSQWRCYTFWIHGWDVTPPPSGIWVVRRERDTLYMTRIHSAQSVVCGHIYSMRTHI